MQSASEAHDPFAHKVVILGDSRVGKTSMITRQMLGYQPATQNATIGCHCSEIHVIFDKKDITLQVWDTAGQEMYRALVPVYLRGAHAAILVYDVTDRSSFAALSHWYDVLIDVVPTGTSIYVVGNKIDLDADAVIEDGQAEQFAKEHDAELFKVSAITGQGLDAVFEAIARKLVEGVEPDDVSGIGVANLKRGHPCQC
jgi:small GTP-binding protein